MNQEMGFDYASLSLQELQDTVVWLLLKQFLFNFKSEIRMQSK